VGEGAMHSLHHAANEVLGSALVLDEQATSALHSFVGLTLFEGGGLGHRVLLVGG